MRPSRLSSLFLASLILTAILLQWFQRATYSTMLIVSLVATAVIAIFMSIIWRYRKISQLIACLSFGVLAALFAVAHSTQTSDLQTLDDYAAGARVTIQGRIADEPDRRPTITKYTIDAEHLTLSGQTIPISGLVLINHYDQWPRYHYGDTVEVSGKLELPGKIEDFSYDNYLKRYGIQTVIYRATVELIHAGNRFNFFRLLYAIKYRFESRINQLLPEPHASLLAGLLTGSRRGIPEDVTETFNRTGLTHIIAISGTNITIILAVITSLLFWLPLKWRFFPSILAISCFTLFVGASSSVVRAAIMGGLGLLALQVGRQTDARLSMLWALGLMILWNPLQLWYDAGFQLSFFALAGLIELSPYLTPRLARIPGLLGIRESLIATLSAQVTTAPWLFHLFGRISLIAPLANILVAPLVPIAMLLGFIAVCASVIFFPLGQLIAYLAWACLQLIILIAEVCARVPFGSITTHTT